MNRKTFLILFTSVFSVLLIITIVLIKTGQLTNKQTIFELVEEDGYFTKTEPLVLESLITGSITKRTTRQSQFEDDVMIKLTEDDTKEIVNFLKKIKLKQTVENPQSDRELFYIHLNNNGYTMPYQIDVSLTFYLNEEKNALLYSEVGGYETEDLSLYNKLNEIIEKYSAK